MTEQTEATNRAEFDAMIEALMAHPNRGEILAEIDRRMPGNDEIEFAFMMDANPEFNQYVKNQCR